MESQTAVPTMEELFFCAIEIEWQFGAIYNEFAILFSHIPNLSLFWQGMIQDEADHAQVLEDIRESLSPEQRSAAAQENIWNQVVKVQTLLDQNLLGKIATLDDAFELAHDIEFSEVNAIFSFLATKVIPSKDRLQFVQSHLKNHQRKLLEFGDHFGDRAWRKQIEIQR